MRLKASIVIAHDPNAADVAIRTPFGPIEVDGMQVSVERLEMGCLAHSAPAD